MSQPQQTETQQIPAVEMQGVAKVVYGTPQKLSFDNKRGSGYLIIKATDGTEHRALLQGRTAIRHGLIQWLGADNDKLNWALSRGQGRVPSICKEPRFFRLAPAGSEWTLFGTQSTRFTTADIHKVAAEVRKLGGEGVHVEESDGLSGGYIRMTVIKHSLAHLGITVSLGDLSGRRAAHVDGWGRILACSNQLTIDAREIVKKVPAAGFGGTRRHTKSPMASIIAGVKKFMASGNEIIKCFEAAKKVKLSQDDVILILNYYLGQGLISKKTYSAVFAAYLDDKTAQVPGTLYGLAMAVTWVGTHQDSLQEGVRRDLKTQGGELLVLAPHWTAFMKVVARKQPKDGLSWASLEQKLSEAAKTTPRKSGKKGKAVVKPEEATPVIVPTK